MSQTAARLLTRTLLFCCCLLTATIVVLISPLNSHAGPYTDDLSKCLIKSATGDDRITLVKWVFSNLSLHPAVRPFAAFTAAQRDTINKETAELFSRLLTADCRKETIDALKYEGTGALGASFQLFGQVASRSLMTDPNVAKGMGGVATYLEKDQKLKSLLKAAGVSEENPAASTPAK